MSGVSLLPNLDLVRVQGREVEVAVAVEPTMTVFSGHYPGFALLPGVFVLEAVHQAVLRYFKAAGGERPVLREVTSARFSRPVLPGDLLTVHCRLTPSPGGLGARATCATEGGKAATLRLEYLMEAWRSG